MEMTSFLRGNQTRDRDPDDDALLGSESEPVDQRSWSLSRNDHTLKQKIFLFLDDPTYSRWSFLWLIWISFLVFVSFTVQCLLSIETLDGDNALFAIDTFYTFFFTIEYIGRLITAPDKKKFLMSFMNLMDFLSIVPYYLNFLPQSIKHLKALRACRTVRLTRLFRLYRMSSNSMFLQGFLNALRKGLEGILFLLVALVLLMFVFSSAIHYIETSECTVNDHKRWVCISSECAGKETPFQSIPASFWWFIVTFTNVGYGDDLPITYVGKIVAVIAMVVSLIFLAFPVTLLTGVYSDAIREIRHKRMIRRINDDGEGEPEVDHLQRMFDPTNLFFSSDAIASNELRGGSLNNSDPASARSYNPYDEGPSDPRKLSKIDSSESLSKSPGSIPIQEFDQICVDIAEVSEILTSLTHQVGHLQKRIAYLSAKKHALTHTHSSHN